MPRKNFSGNMLHCRGNALYLQHSRTLKLQVVPSGISYLAVEEGPVRNSCIIFATRYYEQKFFLAVVGSNMLYWFSDRQLHTTELVTFAVTLVTTLAVVPRRERTDHEASL